MAGAQTAHSSEQITCDSKSSFAASFRFLPEEKRKALTALYAYCRVSDDIVDLADTAQDGWKESARREIDDWKRSTLECLRGGAAPSHPTVLRDAAWAAARYRIPESLFLDLIAGVEMDLERQGYRTFDELNVYCYRVAGAVGLMCLEVFGYGDPKCKDFAVDLGLAFQLTNILRDVRTDWGRQRVYLPESDLERFGFDRHSFGRALSGPAEGGPLARLESLLRFQADRAESYYRKARSEMPPSDRRSLLAAEIMSAVYHAILAKIRARPSRVLGPKVRLSRAETAWRVLSAWLSNRLHP